MKSIPVSSILYFLLSLGVLFVNANTFTDSQIFPKWMFMFTGLGVIGCFFSFYLFRGKRFICNAKCCYYTVIISCFLQAGYGILQFFNILSSHSITYNVVGSFDNPAGFAGSLCAGLPFTFYFLQYSNKKVQWASWCALFVIVLGVLLSESRARSISILTVLVIYFIHQNKNKFHYKKHIGSFLLCLSFLLISIFVISVTVYHLKKDSADGRLLIWRCTWEMIKHEPFTGYGVGGFSAHYMDYQAQYFKEHPDSQFAILADNIKSPFNEYLSVGVQFGILTWVLLIAAGIFLILCHRKHPTKAGYVSLLSLLSIAVFSFFSYPFTYPFIWIISALSVSTLIGKAYENTLFQKTTIIKRGIAFFLLIGSLFLLIEVVSRIKAELEWGKVAHMSLCGRTNDMLPRYHNLLHTFRRNPYFLYNYSAELCVAEKYKECLAITAICCNYWSDYNLELVQAEAYIGLKQYDAAKHHLEKATLMCPVRFIPLYRLHYVYMKQGKAEKANRLAQLIIEKPIKKNSTIIQKIKAEMKHHLSRKTCLY